MPAIETFVKSLTTSKLTNKTKESKKKSFYDNSLDVKQDKISCFKSSIDHWSKGSVLLTDI